ncbi:MAG: hypothetical protein KGI19_10540 [Thaumarchaeota archaeon]|nr:hypothetical protein [Nitrososphaerota archaeon]
MLDHTQIDFSSLGVAILAVGSAVLVYLFQKRSDLLKDVSNFDHEISQFRSDSKNKLVDDWENLDTSTHSEIVNDYRVLLSKLDDLHLRDSRLILLIGLSSSIVFASAIISISMIVENNFGYNKLGDFPIHLAIFVITMLVVLHAGMLISEIREEKR